MPPTPVIARFPRTPAYGRHHTRYLLHTLLRWNPTDAHAVRIRITDPTTQKTQDWLTARDLLAAGLDTPTAPEHGDVFIGPLLVEDPDTGDVHDDPDHIEILIQDPKGAGGNLALIYRTDCLRTFLGNTYRQVPAGSEHYEWTHADLYRREGAA